MSFWGAGEVSYGTLTSSFAGPVPSKSMFLILEVLGPPLYYALHRNSKAPLRRCREEASYLQYLGRIGFAIGAISALAAGAAANAMVFA